MRLSFALGAVLLAAAAAGASAQSAAASDEVTGFAGYRTRQESGDALKGFALGAGYAAAMRGTIGWEAGVSYAQMTAFSPPPQSTASIRENSLEMAGRVRISLVRTQGFSMEGAAGPVLSLALGCTSGNGAGGGTGAYGSTQCVNSFAKSGARIGVDAGAKALWRAGRQARVFLGIDAAAGTVNAGNGVAVGAQAGLRIALKR